VACLAHTTVPVGRGTVRGMYSEDISYLEHRTSSCRGIPATPALHACKSLLIGNLSTISPLRREGRRLASHGNNTSWETRRLSTCAGIRRNHCDGPARCYNHHPLNLSDHALQSIDLIVRSEGLHNFHNIQLRSPRAVTSPPETANIAIHDALPGTAVGTLGVLVKTM
jgi:hypothetical protein